MAIDTGGRPLSPHLQVYRLPLAAILSITHRITGVGLAMGTVGLICWLMALASGEQSFAAVQSFYASWFGKFLLFGYSVALLYHLCTGIRHLFWDAGMNLGKDEVERSDKMVIGGVVVLTVVLWLVALI